MQTKFWVRRIVLAAVWGLAVSTWASIAHYLLGMPDIGLPLVVAVMSYVLLRPVVHLPRRHAGPQTANAAMHRSIPTA